MGNIWIRRVEAIREDGFISTVELTPGLNFIVGPSNTGKSRIAKTISFACGKQQLPFTEKTKYHTAAVTFVTPQGEVRFSRSTRPHVGLEVESTDPRIASGRYSLSAQAKMPLNNALLAMLGIESSRKIIQNESFKKISFTWDAVDHLILVPEDQIGRPAPTSLFPKSVNIYTKTKALCALLVLAQDMNFDHTDQHESESERKARRRIIEQFVFGQLDRLGDRIKEIADLEESAKRSGHSLDAHNTQLRQRLQTVAKKHDTLINEDAQLVEQISKLSEQIERSEVLATQRDALVSQYSADIARLEFRMQSMVHDTNHPQPDTCQFCDNPIRIEPPTASDIEECRIEIRRIGLLREGAVTDHMAQMERLRHLHEMRDQAIQAHQRNMATLQAGVLPAQQAIDTQLQQLAGLEKLKARREAVSELINRFNRELDELRKRAENQEKFKPRDHFDTGFYYTMRKNIRHILDVSRFPGSDVADFNQETLDIEVADTPRPMNKERGTAPSSIRS